MSVPLLIVRPEPGATATASKARALGFMPICAPLFITRALDWQAPSPHDFEAVMMTSASAARLGGAALAQYHHLPLYAVGHATAVAARAAGFENVTVGDTDVAALLATIAARGDRNILHIGGAELTIDHSPGLNLTRRIVYAAVAIVPAPAIPETPHILLHSPRAAAQLATRIPITERRSRTLVTISAATAKAAGDGWCDVHIAILPNDDDLLACAAKRCKLI